MVHILLIALHLPGSHKVFGHTTSAFPGEDHLNGSFDLILQGSCRMIPGFTSQPSPGGESDEPTDSTQYRQWFFYLQSALQTNKSLLPLWKKKEVGGNP